MPTSKPKPVSPTARPVVPWNKAPSSVPSRPSSPNRSGPSASLFKREGPHS